MHVVSASRSECMHVASEHMHECERMYVVSERMRKCERMHVVSDRSECSMSLLGGWGRLEHHY